MSNPMQQLIAGQVKLALAEDVGAGDLTAQLIPADTVAQGKVISREHAVLCGIQWFDETFAQIDGRVRVAWTAADGDRVQPNQQLCSLEGPARALLTGE